MKRARFTEEQIIAVLKEHEAGAKTADLARKHGVSEATLYNWKAKFGGMDVSEAKRLKQLEDENARLKKLLADHAHGGDAQRMEDRVHGGPFHKKAGGARPRPHRAASVVAVAVTVAPAVVAGGGHELLDTPAVDGLAGVEVALRVERDQMQEGELPRLQARRPE